MKSFVRSGSKLQISWSLHAVTKRSHRLQGTSHKRRVTSVKFQANKMIDTQDYIGYIVFRTAAGDPAVFGNGNGPLRGQLNASPPRSWRQVHRKNVQRGCDLELPGLWFLRGRVKRQASSVKRQARVSSVKRQASQPWARGSCFRPQASSSLISFPS